MKTIGLTGGIGCGKTTVLQVFQNLGISCFVADQWAGRYYEESAFQDNIYNLFKDTAFSNGRIDKKKIASIVFHDSTKQQALNALIHPRIKEDFVQWRSLQSGPFVLFESAILYEYGFDKLMDSIIAVYVEKEERIRRLIERDQTTRTAIESRMQNQLSPEEKMDRANYVILNYEGNPRERQVRSIYNRIIAS